MKKIQFIAGNRVLHPYALPPEPAVSNLPQWYKDMEMYWGADKLKVVGGTPNITAKKCIPLRDAMSSGYLIPTIADIQVAESGDYMSWAFPHDVVTTHILNQVSSYKVPEGFSGRTAYKWYNPWIVKTPPGYSCLFVHPLHRADLPFYSLPGVVDTDKHPVAVNLPFFMRDGFEGIIEKGTPMIQVIPFKRDAWKSEIINEVPADLVYKEDSMRTKILSYYSTNFWSRKEYK